MAGARSTYGATALWGQQDAIELVKRFDLVGCRG
jgi:hypothetical protein